MNASHENPYAVPADKEQIEIAKPPLRETFGIFMLSAFVGAVAFYAIAVVGGAILQRLVLHAPIIIGQICWIVLFGFAAGTAFGLTLKCWFGLRYPGNDPHDRVVTRNSVLRSRKQ
ncbi:MAG: hypothetical protein KDA89_13610 [Planctomycetaceae bacterium]|nr:hypothetical protein [Planctomycetaceae bacterium]